MRRAAKRDTVEPNIVAALQAAGCSVERLSQGDGVPDLLVCRPDDLAMRLLEVKSPGGTLTPQQERWRRGWIGPVFVVTTPAEALAAVWGA